MSLVDWFNRRIAPWITAIGVTPRSVTLEVRGRKSGKPIRLSMSPSRLDDEQYLVSLAGERGWVKNVRAANGEAVIIHRGRTAVRLTEVPPDERAPILLAYVRERAFTRSARRAARLYFGLEAPTLEDMQGL
ncbi:MAG: nitroreductase/quinone reductase family protein, partial [Myxococcales bacterium]|nr:nitroreductase/quinone reductase family protein [Myxococcales bacterium]